MPRVLKQNDRVILVECPEICLRIIDSQNYVSSTISDLAQEFGEHFVYFPRKWNKKCLYEYVGNIPPCSDFFCFDDSDLQCEKKEIFVKNFKGKWHLKKELLENTKQKVILNTKAVLNFLRAVFDMQQILFQHFSKETTLMFHPFNRPILTFAGFAYQIFLFLSNADIRMTKGPIEYNSSKGEIEFANFLAHISSQNLELEHTWSPQGQTKVFLPTSIPDIYDKKNKILYYYNGCYIHGHSPNYCKFQNSSSQLERKEKSTIFYDKMHKLAMHPEVSKIKIIWQCSWVHLKRENPTVKSFIRNIYKNPPSYRLDPRCSGMFGYLYG